MHAFKVLLEEVQLQFPDKNFNKKATYFEVAQEITFRIRKQKYYDESDFLINPKTLQRYWGYSVYGRNNKRYSPNVDSVNRLAEFLGYKNWNDFEKKSRRKEIKTVFPYERKINFWRKDFFDTTKMKINEIQYIGDENKYIAIENTFYGPLVIDIKNVNVADSFIFLMITGIELIYKQKEKIIIEINLRY